MSSADETLAAFRSLPLTVKMRAAASVLLHARARDPHAPRLAGVATKLVALAGEWEAEDKAAAQEQLVEELARVLYVADGNRTPWEEMGGGGRSDYLTLGRSLLDRYSITPKGQS